MAKKLHNGNKARNIIIALLVVVVLVLLLRNNKPVPTTTTPSPAVTGTPAKEPSHVTTSKKEIKEENFSGSAPVIVGSGELAVKARAWIDQNIADFRTQANTDVPDIKAKFGADAPPAHYTIDIMAAYVKAKKTESIVLTRDAYTGGANDNESFKVFTASLSTGKVLLLSDIIAPAKQTAFVGFMKTKLTNWRPQGSEASVVFPESVDELKFSSFTNWSFDDSNLIIYFDKYEIGPGVLGAVPFPLPLDKVSSYLALIYQ